MIRIPAVALAMMLMVPALARADEDEAQTSIFTKNSFELRRDERLFALFAALNVDGFDRAEAVRTKPFPRYAFHPLREKLRQQLGTSEKLRGPLDHYFDAHPETIDTYVTAALTLSPTAPFSSNDQTPSSLLGLDQMLSDFAASANLAKLSKSFGPQYREIFKHLRTVVDAPFAQLRSAYHLNEEEAPNLVLMPNPLDAADVALARHTPDGSHVVVFGLPAKDGDLNLQPALKAYSALLAQEGAENVTAAGIDDALAKLKAKGTLAAGVSVENVVRDSLRIAVESKLWSKDAQADVDAAFQHGYVYAPEFFKALSEPAESFPADKGSFAAQVVGRVDLKKVMTEAEKGQPGPK